VVLLPDWHWAPPGQPAPDEGKTGGQFGPPGQPTPDEGVTGGQFGPEQPTPADCEGMAEGQLTSPGQTGVFVVGGQLAPPGQTEDGVGQLVPPGQYGTVWVDEELWYLVEEV
jgi:hypothetical protein